MTSSAGIFETPERPRSSCARSGDFDSAREPSAKSRMRADGRLFRLGDIAERLPRLRRSAGCRSCASQGKTALAIGDRRCAKGGDIIALGKRLDARDGAIL